MQPNLDLSLQHLQIELARVDILIRYEVRRWQLAGQDPEDKFRGLYVADAEAATLLDRPFGTSWGQTVALPAEETQPLAQAQEQLIQQAEALREEVREQGHLLRLDYLAAVFGLNAFEVDTLLICLAPHLDLRYEKLYGYLQDDVTRKRPTVNLVLDLLCEPGPARMLMLPYFADDAPLFHYHLLAPPHNRRMDEAAPRTLLSQPLSLDKTVIAWLLGQYQPHEALREYVSLLHEPGDPTDPQTLGGSHQKEGATHRGVLAPELRAALTYAATVEHAILVFHGPDQTGGRMAARFFAAHVARRLLVVDLNGVIQAGTPPLDALRLALRDARLTGAIPYLGGWDAVLTQGMLPPALLSELCAYTDFIIVAGETQWHPKGVARDRRLFWLEFPIPDYEHRLALWQHFLGEATSPPGPAASAKSEPAERGKALDVIDLAGQFLLTSGQIRDAVASAGDIATQEKRAMTIQDLFTAARIHSTPRLSGLARKITPRYIWDDIVLPADQRTQLHEIVNTVRKRPTVLETWGVGRKLTSGNGITVLFTGPPGTGKTMAAEVIAADLGLDLYKIDLSTVVSKYIGETEKNLERIFSEAQSSNAILFFDEADALFGKRSEVKDAHDRYANIEVSYLLQRMEAYDGVTILATNLRANVDEAFTRRLQFAVNFPFPEEEDRLRIWRTLFPADVPRAPGLDLALLARRFRLAGGNIRNILVGAAYLAASEETDHTAPGDGAAVTMQHLLHATRRELQKMGRLVNEKDLRLDDAAAPGPKRRDSSLPSE